MSNEQTPEEINFEVDAELLSELGERLVGRPHIALAELVKNAYDADATVCEIEVSEDSITVRDNGAGMGREDFLNNWMRVGTTHKQQRQNSDHYGRPLTGSKGIGRLAVQFLAHEMRLRTSSGGGETGELLATINWDEAKRSGNLTSATVTLYDQKSKKPYAKGASHGCEIDLRRLKHDWCSDDFKELGRQVWVLQPPFAGGSNTRSQGEFRIVLASNDPAEELEFQDSLTAVLDTWKARIRGRVAKGRDRPVAEISVDFAAKYGKNEPESYETTVRLPEFEEADPDEAAERVGTWNVDYVDFEIRIFHPHGKQLKKLSVDDVRGYLEQFGGVNIYDGGFRLPYYGPEHDWLDLEIEHARRRSTSKLLPAHLQEDRALQDLPTNRRVFGVVNVNTSHEQRRGLHVGAESLDPGRILTINPGRDRLVDNDAYQQLKRLIQWSLHYYATRYRRRVLEGGRRERPQTSPQEKATKVFQSLEEHQDEMSDRARESIEAEIRDYVKTTSSEIDYQKDLHQLLGPLATAGMVALAIHHETGRLLHFLDQTAASLRRCADNSGENNAILLESAKSLEDWSEQQRSLRGLFAPLADEEDRATSRRYRIGKVLERVHSSMKSLMPNVTVNLDPIPAHERLPNAPLADWNALFQNVFTNAANAMLDVDPKIIQCVLFTDDDGVTKRLRVMDNGVGLGVQVGEASKLFQPFERQLEISRERRALGMGGQGLGLTIVQMIAEHRGCYVRFVEPEPGWSTAFEISWSED